MIRNSPGFQLGKIQPFSGQSHSFESSTLARFNTKPPSPAQALARIGESLEEGGRDSPLLNIALLKVSGRSAVFSARLDGEKVVVKQFYQARKALIVQRLKAALDCAALHMHDPCFQVIKPLEILPDQGIAILSHAPGKTVAAHLPGLPANERAALLTRCGAWHVSYIGNRHKTARFSADFWHNNLSQILPPPMRADKKYIFETLLGALRAEIPPIAGAPQIIAATHGDFGVENLMIDNAVLTGIDIETTRWMPVAREAARFLVWLHSSYPPPAQTMRHGIFEDDKTALFASGLMQAGNNPAVFRFFIGHQLLLRFMHMRADPVTYERLLKMITNFLGARP